MSHYGDESEDSFEDFLEWRKWKKERQRHARKAREQYLRGGDDEFNVVTSTRSAYVTQGPQVVEKISSGARSFGAAVSGGVRRAGNSVASSVRSAVRGKGKGEDVELAVSTSGVPSGPEFLQALQSSGNKLELRRQLQAQADGVLSSGAYQTSDGSVVELPHADIVRSVDSRKSYTGSESFKAFPNSFSTTAHFVKADAIETSLFLRDRKKVNPVVLIPADPTLLGGGFKGVDSLEEQVYRRSTLGAAFQDGYSIPEGGCVYVPDVLVYRDSEQKSGYAWFKAPRKVSFILASSVRNPKYERTGRAVVMDADSTQKTQATLRSVFRAALSNGHDSIVLPAFGCGFNGNPPDAIAKIIRELLVTEFSDTFKHVTFAIIEDENSNKAHNPEGNIRPFQQEFLIERTTAGAGCCGGGPSAGAIPVVESQ